jgi:hypothetical protein
MSATRTTIITETALQHAKLALQALQGVDLRTQRGLVRADLKAARVSLEEAVKTSDRALKALKLATTLAPLEKTA